MFWLAWTRADPQQDSISVQYEPPNDLRPGECGALVDNAVALRCITATITDLSIQGYLTIEQKEMTPSGTMLASTLSRVGAEAKEASDQYQALSGTSEGLLESVALSDLQQARFSMRLTRIRNAIFNRLVADGY